MKPYAGEHKQDFKKRHIDRPVASRNSLLPISRSSSVGMAASFKSRVSSPLRILDCFTTSFNAGIFFRRFFASSSFWSIRGGAMQSQCPVHAVILYHSRASLHSTKVPSSKLAAELEGTQSTGMRISSISSSSESSPSFSFWGCHLSGTERAGGDRGGAAPVVLNAQHRAARRPWFFVASGLASR